eukprot:TRINITY_DN11738_c0_g1_i1.p1 TRINITY_DN11738_c0_g1~~TRINITY_DN11738_c0_g1_i1.p1  ORF type:complete len:267 (+),score=36.46 TRINITY_DN11738_c0_g1_i1:68-868(+)
MEPSAGYTFVCELARGGQAEVWKALPGDEGDDVLAVERVPVAVKVFNVGDAPAVMRSELQYLTALQGHRNIVRLLDVFERPGGPNALVLEMCSKDLQRLASRHPFAERRAIEIMRGVLCALVHVHELNIIHRDVKPENIALAENDCSRLMDFGVATCTTDEEKMRKFRGSVGYAAPEVHARQTYGFPVDVFASGATFYFLLCGKTEAMTDTTIIERTMDCLVTFGLPKFENVSRHTEEMIIWLMHNQAFRRPGPSRALRHRPFTAA